MGLVPLEKKLQRDSLLLPPCEEIVRRQWLMNQEEGPHQNVTTLWGLDHGLPSPQNCEQ